VARIDAYYVQHPDQLTRPVADALFQAVVIPAIKATQQGGRTQ
jgi:hypothetical protein